MAVRTRKHVTVKVKDGTATPIECTIGPGPGDVQIQGLTQNDKESLPVYNRGEFLELVEGDRTQITGSITVYHDGDMTAAASVMAAIRKTNDFAAGVTVDPGGVMWALDVEITITRSGVTNVITLNTCVLKVDYQEAKEQNTLTISFTCYEGGTIT